MVNITVKELAEHFTKLLKKNKQSSNQEFGKNYDR